jgi:PAS domain-containing protein
MALNSFRKQFTDIEDACALAQAIVDTVREPVLVFDKDLRVIAASRSFYAVFKVSPQDTRRSFAGHVDCGCAGAPPCIGCQRAGRNNALSLKAV